MDEYRRRSLEEWELASPGWRRRALEFQRAAAPVSQWLIDAVRLQPGHRVLELAAGTGETGLLAAELVAPGGSVVISDQAEGMIEGARERARELGLDNVEFKVLNAEWIDMDVATVDAVLSRFGYMLVADPGAALSEARRVLRPGGRIALAVWDARERNPWLALAGRELLERGHVPPPDPDAPGPFALSDHDKLRALLGDAGFADVELEVVEVAFEIDDADEYWLALNDMSRALAQALAALPQEEVADIRAALERAVEAYAQPGGGYRIPGAALVAAADA